MDVVEPALGIDGEVSMSGSSVSPNDSLVEQLHGVSRRDLAERAAQISQTYRAGGATAAAVRSDADALAYAVTRLPATSAAASAAVKEVAARLPGFAPHRLLDAGAGCGAASLAAISHWPSLRSLALVDQNPFLLALAEKVLRSNSNPGQHDIALLRQDLLVASVPLPAAELVVASYIMVELTPAQRQSLLERLLAAGPSVIVLVEPGTPAGFEVLRALREALIARGGHIVAPCPHDGACPMAGAAWCHFSVRLPRSRDHKLVKRADVPFEDERYAYVAAALDAPSLVPVVARVIGTPIISKSDVALSLCTTRGLERRFVPRRSKPAYARARRLQWGDAVDTGDP